MIPAPDEHSRIYIKPGATDMRKSINGLCAIVQNQFKLDPYSSSIYLFSNRRSDRIKILYWNRNGFCLWLKRLEVDRFPWPEEKCDVKELTQEELRWLLSGVDFRRAHRTLHYDFSG